jgi:TonB-dependent starch-binding outer membrane protein SusC
MTLATFDRTGSPTRLLLPLAFLMALLVWAPAGVEAQETATVTGEVTEVGTQRPMVGVQVVIDGTTIGGLTNQRGVFTIPGVPAGEVTVRAHIIGYASQSETVTVGAGETVTVDFQLRQTTLALDQIVVTGAGAAMERRRLGNTIATIDVGDLQTAPVQNLSEILSGREPGVVGLTSGGIAGEGARFRIRGSASLSQANEPVVYVDGVRVDNAGGFGPGISAGGGGTPSRLDDLNPESIERIEILKGAAAATLYGTQASNGVIQIFTKRGQAGAPQYSVSVEQGFTRVPTDRFLPHAAYVMDTGPTMRNFGRNDLGTTGVQERWGLSVQPFEVFELDLFPELFGTGHSQTYSMSVTGGTQAVTYFVSGRFQKEDGPYDGSAFEQPGFRVANDENERLQFNANVELFPRDDLRVRVSSGYTEMSHSAPDNNNNIFGVVSSLINSRPESASPTNLFGSPSFATTRENFHRLTTQDVQRFGGAVTAIYQATPNINIDATVGIDFVNQRAVRFLPFGWNVDGFASANVAGSRTVSDRNHREVTLDVKGIWSTALGPDWTSELVVGGQGFLTRTESSFGTGDEFPGPGLEVAGAGANQTVFEGFLEEVNAGLMLQNQFGFRDYAFLTLGGRYDEHSAFGETAGGAFYPKVSASVMPSDMPMWTLDAVSTFRLRGALGQSGLQPGAFDSFTTFAPLASADGPGVSPANLGNPDLMPETSLEWELGTEVGFLDDRAALDFTYWNRTVSDMLVDRQFPPSGGFSSPQLDNIGEMRAWGWELQGQVVAVTQPNFSANLFANISFTREKITDMGGAPALKVGGAYPRYRQFTMENHHPGSFFGPVLDTIVELPLHVDGNCVPLSRAEALDFFSEPRDPTRVHPYVEDCGGPNMLLTFLGKPVPDYQGAFGTDMTFWGSFTLRSLFEYRFGNYHIHDLDGAFRRSHFLIGRNMRDAVEVESTMLNPASTPEQRLEAAEKWVRELQALSPYDGLNEIHEADWLRLREVSLTYRAPAAWAERVGARSLSITASGRNLALWTKFPGTDPELNFNSRGSVSGGLDENFGDGTVSWGIPIPRRFTFQVRAGF